MNETPSYFTDGAAYDRLMGRWSRAAGEVFLDWLALPPGLSWLDVGCGTGVFTELLLERGKAQSASAVDPAADQIAYARTKPANKQVDFRLADAQSLPFADRTFDAAAMALVMSFVPDAAKAVAEMKRVVKPGGIIGTYVWDFLGNGSPPQPLRAAVEAMGYEVPPMPGHRNSQLETLKGYLPAPRWMKSQRARSKSRSPTPILMSSGWRRRCSPIQPCSISARCQIRRWNG